MTAPTAFFCLGKQAPIKLAPVTTCAIEIKKTPAPAAARLIAKEPEADERQDSPKYGDADASETQSVPEEGYDKQNGTKEGGGVH